MRRSAHPLSRLVRRAVHWMLWSRRNAIRTVSVLASALVVFTAASMITGVVQARQNQLAAGASSPAGLGSPTATATRTHRPGSLLDLTGQPAAAGLSPADSSVAKVTLPPGPPGKAATRFTRAFCRPRLASALWWRAVQPLLSSTGQLAYHGTDPALVPCHRVTGSSRVQPVVLENAADVQVPTDAGLYRVQLSRRDPGQGWVVERAVPMARR